MAYVLKNIVGTSLLYGNTVYFTESGESTPYILVGQGNSNNYLFMRMYAPSDKVSFHATADDVDVSERVYQGNSLDVFCSNTFYNRFTTAWQKIFVNNKIEVTNVVNDGSSYQVTINRKVFAPSASELGVSTLVEGVPDEGSAYTCFTTNVTTKRKCRAGDSNGDYVTYWTRSRNDKGVLTTRYYGVTINGDGGYDAGSAISSWLKMEYYVRPIISINEDVSITKEAFGWVVIPNLPPETPDTIEEKFTVNNGELFSLSWGSSADSDGPQFPNYRLQARIDSGQWSDVALLTDTTFNKSLAYKEAAGLIEYRVQAFDSYDNASEWAKVATITVVNNLPPSGPSYVLVNGKYKNEQVAVSWGLAEDEDDNLSGYNVYRSINKGAYSLVATTENLVFRETAGDWDSVSYKIHAFDAAGVESLEYKESEVTLINRITMVIVVEDDSDIKDGFYYVDAEDTVETDKTLKVALSDSVEGDSYYVVCSCDDKTVGVIEEATTGQLLFEIYKEEWQKLNNGPHDFVVEVTNSAGYTVKLTISIEKDVRVARITLAEPIEINTEEPVSSFLLNIKGFFPEGSILDVKVTNNANDDVPVWQTVSAREINTNEFIEFSNTVVANGNAFNFIVVAKRGTASEGGYISSINGMFGKNMFDYILERIDAIENEVIN